MYKIKNQYFQKNCHQIDVLNEKYFLKNSTADNKSVVLNSESSYRKVYSNIDNSDEKEPCIKVESSMMIESKLENENSDSNDFDVCIRLIYC